MSTIQDEETSSSSHSTHSPNSSIFTQALASLCSLTTSSGCHRDLVSESEREHILYQLQQEEEDEDEEDEAENGGENNENNDYIEDEDVDDEEGCENEEEDEEAGGNNNVTGQVVASIFRAHIVDKT